LTGLHLVDGAERMVVLEGLGTGAMQLVAVRMLAPWHWRQVCAAVQTLWHS
jgi:hypothetical protein